MRHEGTGHGDDAQRRFAGRPAAAAPLEAEVTARSGLHRFSVGRSPDCDLVLADASVSRRHAEVSILEDGQIFVVDCRSTHGTRVSHGRGQRDVRQDVVAADAVLHFGDVAIAVSDVVRALRSRHGGVVSNDLPRHSEAGVRPDSWARGTRLVRCGCGVIKPKDARRCPECGA